MSEEITDPGVDPITGIDPYPSYQNAVNNLKIAAQTNSNLLNASLKAIYLVKFNNWALNVESGVIPNTNPPKPPLAYVPTYDPSSGFTFPAFGTQPVCDMPPIPNGPPSSVISAPNTICVGKNIPINGPSDWFTVGPGDTFGPGRTTPPVLSADGVMGVFERFGSPISAGSGWYLKVG